MQRMFQLALPQPIDECLEVVGDVLVADAACPGDLAVCLVTRKAIRDTSVCPIAYTLLVRESACRCTARVVSQSCLIFTTYFSMCLGL